MQPPACCIQITGLLPTFMYSAITQKHTMPTFEKQKAVGPVRLPKVGHVGLPKADPLCRGRGPGAGGRGPGAGGRGHRKFCKQSFKWCHFLHSRELFPPDTVSNTANKLHIPHTSSTHVCMLGLPRNVQASTIYTPNGEIHCIGDSPFRMWTGFVQLASIFFISSLNHE